MSVITFPWDRAFNLSYNFHSLRYINHREIRKHCVVTVTTKIEQYDVLYINIRQTIYNNYTMNTKVCVCMHAHIYV